MEKFVVIDEAELGKERYLFIVEAKRSSLGANGTMLVSMNDIGDKYDGSTIHGFVTTGDGCRMLKYHDRPFQVPDKTEVPSVLEEKNLLFYLLLESVLVPRLIIMLSG